MSTSNGKRTATIPQRIELAATPDVGKAGRYIVVAIAHGHGEEVHRDTLSLNSARARKAFINDTMHAAFEDVPQDDWHGDEWKRLERELNQDLRALAKVPPGPAEPSPAADKAAVDPRIEALSGMPEDIKAEAERRLHAADLLDSIGEDIGKLGVVGEAKNRLIIYLVGTSTQLPRPLAAIVCGSSSSGKSFLCERVSLMFPPEVVLRATGMTTNALFYFEKGTLTHRWVVAGERSRVEDDDQAEATRALREMIEGGRLSKAAAVKEGDRIVTRLIEQPGPIAYIETTTLDSIFGEDANRCLLINTDEGARQTELIINATAAAAGGRSTAAADRLCQVHHAMQRMLPRVEVDVPFASAIAKHYPKDRVECRRDFRHLLQLVRASALLHFKQRDRSPDGRVVASLADYGIAEALASEPLASAASGVSEGVRKFLNQLRDAFGESEFTTTEAKQLDGVKPRSVDKRLTDLCGCGAVEQLRASSGNVPARWKLTGGEPDAGNGRLPTLRQVAEAFAACARAHGGERS